MEGGVKITSQFDLRNCATMDNSGKQNTSSQFENKVIKNKVILLMVWDMQVEILEVDNYKWETEYRKDAVSSFGVYI